MLNWLRKDRFRNAAVAVYTPIVAQSRHPRFYADWGVPDTVAGRFDMISLHVALVLHRLRGDAAAAAFSQSLFDLFFRDMDRSLREMGVGDLSVPKRIARMTEMFYGLLGALGEGLDSSDRDELAAVLSRNIFATEPNAAGDLAVYVTAQADTLASQPVEMIVSGRIVFEPVGADA